MRVRCERKKSAMVARMDAPHAKPVPYLSGSGDLGLNLHNLICAIDKLDKIAQGERLCSCGGPGSVDNAPTLNRPPTACHPVAQSVYAALCGVLAACGRLDALRLVEGHRPHPAQAG